MRKNFRRNMKSMVVMFTLCCMMLAVINPIDREIVQTQDKVETECIVKR